MQAPLSGGWGGVHFAPNPTLPATEQWVGELLRERDLGQAGGSQKQHVPDTERISIELSSEVLAAVDRIKEELGLRSRAGLIERLLEELLIPAEEE